MEDYKVKIDQLPEETIQASDPHDASRKVADLLGAEPTLRRLHDDEPVQIKKPDGTPWGRHLTVGDFRKGPVTEDGSGTPGIDDGPVRPAKP